MPCIKFFVESTVLPVFSRIHHIVKREWLYGTMHIDRMNLGIGIWFSSYASAMPNSMCNYLWPISVLIKHSIFIRQWKWETEPRVHEHIKSYKIWRTIQPVPCLFISFVLFLILNFVRLKSAGNCMSIYTMYGVNGFWYYANVICWPHTSFLHSSSSSIQCSALALFCLFYSFITIARDADCWMPLYAFHYSPMIRILSIPSINRNAGASTLLLHYYHNFAVPFCTWKIVYT